MTEKRREGAGHASCSSVMDEGGDGWRVGAIVGWLLGVRARVVCLQDTGQLMSSFIVVDVGGSGTSYRSEAGGLGCNG